MSSSIKDLKDDAVWFQVKPGVEASKKKDKGLKDKKTKELFVDLFKITTELVVRAAAQLKDLYEDVKPEAIAAWHRLQVIWKQKTK